MRPEDIEECSSDGGLRGARATDEHGEARAERLSSTLAARSCLNFFAQRIRVLELSAFVTSSASTRSRSDRSGMPQP